MSYKKYIWHQPFWLVSLKRHVVLFSSTRGQTVSNICMYERPCGPSVAELSGWSIQVWGRPRRLKSRVTHFLSSQTRVPFLSPRKLISLPDIQTWPFHPLFSDFFFSCSRQETNTGVFVLPCGGGWDPPPLLVSQLDVGRWDGKQVSPMTFSVQTPQGSQSGALQGGAGLLASYFSSHHLSDSLHQP